MNRTAFVRLITGLLIGLALVLGGSKLYARFAVPAVEFQPAGGQVGVNGPLIMRFPRPVDRQSVQSRVTIQPENPGQFTWDGPQTLRFTPRPAFKAGLEYALSLQSGAKTEDGLSIPAGRWNFSARAPLLLFLRLQGDSGNLAAWSLDGNETTLTSSGKVTSFAPSPDGEWIAYTALNEQQGSDVWIMPRGGSGAKRLVDCGADRCSAPAWNPIREQVAFVRAAKGTSRAWVVNQDGSQTRLLLNDPLIQASTVTFSPTAAWAALYDPQMKALRVISLTGGQEFLLESNVPSPGAWSPDGKKLLFLNEEPVEGFLDMKVYQVLVDSHTITRLFGPDDVGADLNLPEFAPDGLRLAFGRRVLSGIPGKQVWLADGAGAGPLPLTEDYGYTYSIYRWSPVGDALAVQRYAFGSSDNLPEVAVIKLDGAVLFAAENAADPRWLP